jgi:hypothetical protein
MHNSGKGVLNQTVHVPFLAFHRFSARPDQTLLLRTFFDGVGDESRSRLRFSFFSLTASRASNPNGDLSGVARPWFKDFFVGLGGAYIFRDEQLGGESGDHSDSSSSSSSSWEC